MFALFSYTSLLLSTKLNILELSEKSQFASRNFFSLKLT